MSQASIMTGALGQLLTVAWGLVAARIVSVTALLAFASYTGPEPFAAFGVYFALVTVLWIVVSGGYEQAVVFAKDEAEAHSLAQLSALIAVAVVAGTLLLAVGALTIGAPLPGGLQKSWALVVLPFSLAARSIFRLATQFATRYGRFATLSHAVWAQAFVQSMSMLGLLAAGAEPVLCLAVADAAGYAAATWLACKQLPARLGYAGPVAGTMDKLFATARAWRHLLAWQLPASLLSVLAVTLPVLLLPLGLDAARAGQIVLAMRLLEMPLQFLTGSATPVLQNRLRSAGDPKVVLNRGVLLLATAGLTCFCTIALIALAIQSWFESTRWSLAVAAVPWLAPYFLGLTISGPLIDLVAGVRAERQAMMAHGLFFLAMAGACSLLVSGLDLRWVLAAIGCVGLARAAMFARLLQQAAEQQHGRL